MANPQVTFNYALWILRYPEFVTVTEPLAQLYFNEATLYLRNDGTSPYTDDATQLMLLNMLTAHIAAMNNALSSLAGSPIVGPITSASEGSVSISGQPIAVTGTMAWFLLTRYGAMYWAATAASRTMHYRPGPRRQFNPPFVSPFIPE